MECSDITVAAEHFWIFPDQAVIEQVKDPACPVSSPDTHNSLHLRIGKHVHQFIGALLVGACEVAIP